MRRHEGRDRALVTPTGGGKSELAATHMVEVRRAGRRLKGRRKPTSELDLHLRILQRRPDAGAVEHAPPPPGRDVLCRGGRRVYVNICTPGAYLLGQFGPPGAPRDPGDTAVGDGVEPGRTLDEAWIRMETLEHGARILFVAHLLGRVTELEPGAVAQLEALRARIAGAE